jgi:hypothetical protein
MWTVMGSCQTGCCVAEKFLSRKILLINIHERTYFKCVREFKTNVL